MSDNEILLWMEALEECMNFVSPLDSHSFVMSWWQELSDEIETVQSG